MNRFLAALMLTVVPTFASGGMSPPFKKVEIPLPTAAQLEAYFHFDPETEFPNPFAELKASCNEEAAARALAKQVFETAERLTVLTEAVGLHSGLNPLGTLGPWRELKRVPLLEEVKRSVKRLDPKATVYLVGAPVRDLLARVARDTRSKKGVSFQSAADGLSPGEAISVETLLKVGSTLQFAIEFTPGWTQVHKTGALRDLSRIFNAAGIKRKGFQLNRRHTSSPLKWFEFQELSQFQAEARDRGGFPLESMILNCSTGEITSPFGRHPLELALLGEMEVLPVGAGRSSDLLAAQGLQLLLELPFLHLTRASRDIFQIHLQAAVDSLRSPAVPTSIPPPARASRSSDGALLLVDRVEQALLAQEEGGAHNRLHRSRDPIDLFAADFVKRVMASDANRKASSRYRVWLGSLLLFTRSEPLSESEASRPAPLLELPKEFSGFWMSREEFEASQTDGGWLYHGTSAGPQAFQGGFPVSDEYWMGTAADGSGFYTTPSFSVAAAYAGKSGPVLRMKLKSAPGIRILNWHRVKLEHGYHAICPALEELGHPHRMSCFRMLSEFYGVDIIVNEHVLIQNHSVVELDPTFDGSLRAHLGDLVVSKGVQKTWSLGLRAGVSKKDLMAQMVGQMKKNSKFEGYFREKSALASEEELATSEYAIKAALEMPAQHEVGPNSLFNLKELAAELAVRLDPSPARDEISGILLKTAREARVYNARLRGAIYSNADRLCQNSEWNKWFLEQMDSGYAMGFMLKALKHCPGDFQRALVRSYLENRSVDTGTAVFVLLPVLREVRVPGLGELLNEVLEKDVRFETDGKVLALAKALAFLGRTDLFLKLIERQKGQEHSLCATPLFPFEIQTQDDLNLIFELSKKDDVRKAYGEWFSEMIESYLERFPELSEWVRERVTQEIPIGIPPQ